MLKRRVIVADNDPEITDLLMVDLQAEGHQVVASALGGEEAYRLCLEHRPDVLVIDYRMPPGPNGLEIAARVRSELSEIGVVLYTNYRDADICDEASRIGASYQMKGNIRALRRLVSELQGSTQPGSPAPPRAAG
jgi:DNA-binding NtrC family response regulator